jgi:hypothetical protein
MRKFLIIFAALAMVVAWAVASKYAGGDFANGGFTDGYHRHFGENE